MRNIIFLLLFTSALYSQSYSKDDGYIDAVSIGVDPGPLFDSSSKGGLDVTFKTISSKGIRENGFSIEYFHNIDYLSVGWYENLVIFKPVVLKEQFKCMLGIEILYLSRFNGRVSNLTRGYSGITGEGHTTLSWGLSERFNLDFTAAWIYRRDLKALFNEADLFPFNGRIALRINL